MSEMVYTSFYGKMNNPHFESISYQRKHNNSSVHNVLLGIFLIKGYEI